MAELQIPETIMPFPQSAVLDILSAYRGRRVVAQNIERKPKEAMRDFTEAVKDAFILYIGVVDSIAKGASLRANDRGDLGEGEAISIQAAGAEIAKRTGKVGSNTLGIALPWILIKEMFARSTLLDLEQELRNASSSSIEHVVYRVAEILTNAVGLYLKANQENKRRDIYLLRKDGTRQPLFMPS